MAVTLTFLLSVPFIWSTSVEDQAGDNLSQCAGRRLADRASSTERNPSSDQAKKTVLIPYGYRSISVDAALPSARIAAGDTVNVVVLLRKAEDPTEYVFTIVRNAAVIAVVRDEADRDQGELELLVGSSDVNKVVLAEELGRLRVSLAD